MTWLEENRRFLAAHLDRVFAALEARAARIEGTDAPPFSAPGPTWSLPDPPALAVLCDAFDLTPFECDVILLCVGSELDPRFATVCARLHGDPHAPWPTFALALAALPGAHWDALAPDATLRRWDLIAVDRVGTLAHARLRVDERVWQLLLGLDTLDERALRQVEPVAPPSALARTHENLARSIAAALHSAASEVPVVVLCGRSLAAQTAIAGRSAELLGIEVYRVAADALPTSPDDVERLARIWRREAALGQHRLLIDCHDLDASDALRSYAVTRLAATIPGIVFLACRERRSAGARPTVLFDVDPPQPTEQRARWEELLTPMLGPDEAGALGRTLAWHFDLDLPILGAAAAHASGALGESRDSSERLRALWDACRAQARPQLEGLAERIPPLATWNDLVLPAAQIEILRDVSRYVRRAPAVETEWGFARRSSRGRGTSVLFAGPSGTGKTLAAEVLAADLGLDLYRIDLSAVVSKYIGETEKNLRKVFDAAEAGGSALLFDEADALFGKRSEVKSSLDRHANLEVGYLLQRMEAFRGLAILTTNLKSAIDHAFLRRIRFVVDFPFPTQEQRETLWRRVFPAETPTRDLDYRRLAQLNVSGASIREIVLGAAVLAADEDPPAPAVEMRHLLSAARRHYDKLQQPLTARETEGWSDP